MVRCRPSKMSWLSNAQPRKSTWNQIATTGGMTCRRVRQQIARPNRWTVRICCSFSTPVAAPANPKGVVHTTAGYNLYTHMTTKWIFDLQDTDVYWCTADVGWITGHSYI